MKLACCICSFFLKLNQLSLTNQQTPWIGIRFNKLTVSQLVRYSLNFMEQPERSSPCLQNPATALVLARFNSQLPPPRLFTIFSIHFNNIFSSEPILSSCPFPSRFPTTTFRTELDMKVTPLEFFFTSSDLNN